MHYTSWDRADRDHPRLLVGEGPEVIGTFHKDSAEVDGLTWRLEVDEKEGATATAEDGRVFNIKGNLRRAKRLEANVDGQLFTFINEQGANWIIDDAQSNKVGQFSGTNNGVRAAILEFEQPETPLPVETAAALSWFVRTILENRLNNTAMAVIVGMGLCTLAAVVTFFT